MLSFPFWISIFWVLFLFSFCISLPLSSVVSFNGGLLWSPTYFSFCCLSFHPIRGFNRVFYQPIGCAFTIGSYPLIEGFVLSGSGLGLVLGDLYPLLYKSQVWFKSVREVLRREVMGSEVGSGDLERGASSNVGGEGTGADTATSAPSSSQPSVPAVARSFLAGLTNGFRQQLSTQGWSRISTNSLILVHLLVTV